MTCKEMIDRLSALKTPDANLKVRVGDDWHDVTGIAGTGRPSRRHEHDVSITVGESDKQPTEDCK